MSTTLEERITAAHTSGNKAEVERLQAEFRRTRSVTRVTRPRGTQGSDSTRSELPELAQRYTVELSSRARWDIDDVLDLTADGRETGGCLLGVVTSEGVRIEHASGPSPDAERTHRVVYMDQDHWRRFEGAHARYEGEAWRGDWHTHHDAGHARPSETDLRAWKRCLGESQGAVYVGLIVSSEHFGVAPMRFQTWTVSRRDGRTVCEPATLIT